MSIEYYIPIPDAQIFLYRNNSDRKQNVIRETKIALVVERIDYANGIRVFYQGCTYAKKGFPTPESTLAINICKRVLREAMHFPLLLINKPTKLIQSYIEICHREIYPYILKQEYMTPCSREVQKFLDNFLGKLSIDAKLIEYLSPILSAIIEYDAPYRYRIQDLLSETTAEKLESPKEIRRLISLWMEREQYNEVKRKIKKIRYVTSLLYIPRIRRAYIHALRSSCFSNFQFDQDDRYWVSRRADYNFFGKTSEERNKNADDLQGYTVQV